MSAVDIMDHQFRVKFLETIKVEDVETGRMWEISAKGVEESHLLGPAVAKAHQRFVTNGVDIVATVIRTVESAPEGRWRMVRRLRRAWRVVRHG